MGRAELKVWCDPRGPKAYAGDIRFEGTMVDLWPGAAVIGATVAAVLVPFLVVPEVLERFGYNPRSALVRAIVWASFLAILFIPAAATGFVFSVTNVADWLLFLGALLVAVVWDYYRLNPDKVLWTRKRA